MGKRLHSVPVSAVVVALYAMGDARQAAVRRRGASGRHCHRPPSGGHVRWRALPPLATPPRAAPCCPARTNRRPAPPHRLPPLRRCSRPARTAAANALLHSYSIPPELAALRSVAGVRGAWLSLSPSAASLCQPRHNTAWPHAAARPPSRVIRGAPDIGRSQTRHSDGIESCIGLLRCWPEINTEEDVSDACVSATPYTRGSWSPADYASPLPDPVMRRCSQARANTSSPPTTTEVTVSVTGGSGKQAAHRVPPVAGDDVDRYVAAVLLESLDSLAALLEGGGARVSVVEREIKVTLRSAPTPPSPPTPPSLTPAEPPASPVDSLDDIPGPYSSERPEPKAFFVKLSDEERKLADGSGVVAELMPEKLKRSLHRRQRRREVRAERARRARDERTHVPSTQPPQRFYRESEIRSGRERVQILEIMECTDGQESKGGGRADARVRPSRIPVPVRLPPPPPPRLRPPHTFAAIPEECGESAGDSPHRTSTATGGPSASESSSSGAAAAGGWSLTLRGSGAAPPTQLEVRVQFARPRPEALRRRTPLVRAPPPLSVQGKALTPQQSPHSPPVRLPPLPPVTPCRRRSSQHLIRQ